MKNLIRTIFYFILSVSLICLGIGVFAIFQVSRELPKIPASLDRIMLNIPTEIFDDQGEVLFVLGGTHRVPLDAIASNFKKAILAAEDKNFFSHHGIDKTSLIRAILYNARTGKVVQGASTITQQLTKNLFFSFKKTYKRKLFELLMALQFEKTFSKEEILEVYCNQVYFGAGSYGVEDASRTYFGKHASELTLAEAALLAGLPNSPSRYNPFKNLKGAKRRQTYVLERMFENGMISRQEEQQTSQAPVRIAKRGGHANQTGYFVQYILKKCTSLFGADAVSYGGLQIYTTLNRRMQTLAWKAVNRYLPEIDGLVINEKGDQRLEAALVALEPGTGWIKAMVGGRNYSASQYNRAVAGNRQPGSGFKPIVYYTALQKLHYLPSTVIMDEPFTVEIKGSAPWSPQNFNGGYEGPVILKKALMKSINVIAARLITQTGVRSVIATAKKMGIQSSLPAHLSIALGSCSVSPLEMATAFSVIAAEGKYAKPVAIRRILDNHGNALMENIIDQKQVLDPLKTYMLIDILKGVFHGGTASRARAMGWSRPSLGKTGTTNDFRDAWFTGFTPALGACVWVGYDDNHSMMLRHNRGLTGSRAALPVWVNFMSQALEGEPVRDFPIPPGIKFVEVDTATGREPDVDTEHTMRVAIPAGSDADSTPRPPDLMPLHGP